MINLRLFFKKKGKAVFISHLDLNRTMQRTLRRSGIPVWYTEGFNPHPFITFALPLSLGYYSDYEVMDFRLTEDTYDPDKITGQIADSCPVGIEVISVREPRMKFTDIAYAEYIIEPVNQSDPGLADNIRLFLEQPRIITEKKTKKKTSLVDIKSLIHSFELFDTPDGIQLRVILSAGNIDNLNPSLIMHAFQEQNNINIENIIYKRTGIFNSKLEKFE